MDITWLFQFSHLHCVAICAVLVPANLLITLQSLILTGLLRPLRLIHLSATIGCLLATVMLFHVWTWLVFGVVMLPTYILLWLGSTCLGINLWAIARPASLAEFLRGIFRGMFKIWQLRL